MRKIAAILLMSVLFFNLGGYRLVFPLLQQHADRKLEALLDNEEYDESSLVEVRIAMHLPYQLRFTDYERHYGQVEIDGQSYTYVKRKIEGDSVILKCIPNVTHQRLEEAKNTITKANSAADDNQPGQHPASAPTGKSTLGDFDDHLTQTPVLPVTTVTTLFSSSYLAYLTEVTLSTPQQPPEC